MSKQWLKHRLKHRWLDRSFKQAQTLNQRLQNRLRLTFPHHLTRRLKHSKIWLLFAAGAGALAFGLGAVLPIDHLREWAKVPLLQGDSAESFPYKQTIGAPSAQISPLVDQSGSQRAPQLQTILKTAPSALEKNRARYLLASDLIGQKRGSEALDTLQNLEKDYSVLAPQILLKRAQAYKAAGQPQQAIATGQTLIRQYPTTAASAEGLYLLGQPLSGQQQSQYWDQLLAKFPAHPRALEIVQTRLKEKPQPLSALLIIAKYGDTLDQAEPYLRVLDQLSDRLAPQLTPKDWQAIGLGYWNHQRYAQAADAYARAPQTPLNLYRSGRGLHLSARSGAVPRYQQVLQKFPQSSEASLALKRLADLEPDPAQKLAYLDQLIQQFPDRTPAALVEKSKVFDQLNSQQSAANARQSVLNQYATSDTAAEIRWFYAQEHAKTGDFKTAYAWATPIAVHNPTSPLAAEAGFWAAKWAQRLGQVKDAQSLFQKVVAEHAESYYAWRSASLLGWAVGDFTTVRSLNPQVEKKTLRPELLAGSPALKELYQLGQDQDTWAYWQVEYQNRASPTVAEQFTDGLLRFGVGHHLDGIGAIASLNEREDPQDKAQYQALRKQSAYWQALYPFPYVQEIEAWSEQRQLNPMLVTALIRQESRFESKIKSSAGAVGLMQVMPETASFIAQNIKLKEFKLDNPQDNIKLGTWYLDHTHQEYANNSMLAVASYNAGPGAVSGWVGKAKAQDPDEFVEKIPYGETKGYVKSVLGNYWNYLRLYNPQVSERIAQVAIEHPTIP